jgi:predicted metalloprotease
MNIQEVNQHSRSTNSLSYQIRPSMSMISENMRSFPEQTDSTQTLRQKQTATFMPSILATTEQSWLNLVDQMQQNSDKRYMYLRKLILKVIRSGAINNDDIFK